jgi:hypothetical protein
LAIEMARNYKLVGKQGKLLFLYSEICGGKRKNVGVTYN